MSELKPFIKNLNWEEYIDDDDIKSMLKKIRSRVKRIDNGDESDEEENRIKLVVVGDGAVGKTSLLVTFADGLFPEEYVPTVFDNKTAEIEYQGKTIYLQLWDTAGQEDYDRLRPLSYPGSDIVLLCYSCVSEASYEAIIDKWHPEVSHYAEGVLKLLVGTKLDMREEGIKDPHMDEFEPISSDSGRELAEDIEACGFVECSAKTGKNLQKVFQEAVKYVMENRE
eukprot:TRINITY_DN4780_c1_g1_i5.p1 TRINITY_DN4780_c1_g1~~TRINITY_DN4780_c1_g1_i5.p1  ORF type:complete len:225 (+),score=82.90 TRINITY_DN4780_c1_g1_i5:396-1070(+)